VRWRSSAQFYRYEQTGELSGMTRVRGFTQDDAHLSSRPSKIEPEMSANLRPGVVHPRFAGSEGFPGAGRRATEASKYVGFSEDWASAQATLVRSSRTAA